MHKIAELFALHALRVHDEHERPGMDRIWKNLQLKPDGGVPSNASVLDWLRAEIIGHNLVICTPFGKRILTYADHTASGRSLFFIEQFILEKVLPNYGNTHTEDSHVGKMTSRLVHDASLYIKQCMGGTSNDALFFCGSGCTAAVKRLQEVMGISVPSILRQNMLQTLKQEERWLVFVGPYEHHSNLLSWQHSLAEVIKVPATEKGLIDLARLKEYLEDPKYSNRLKLGSFSACSNVTGILTDTRAIARLLHEHAAFVCFDFASCASHMQIDMRSGQPDGYDAVFLSPHKFVGGPDTPGILLLNKKLYLLQGNAPSTCGGGTVDFVNNISHEHTLFIDDVEARENSGTPPIVQIMRAALAFWIKEQIPQYLIEQCESFSVEKALSRLSSNPNVLVLGNLQAHRMPIISFMIKTDDLTIACHSMCRCEDNNSSIKPMPSNTDDSRELKPNRQKQNYLNGRFVTTLLNDLFGIQARGGCSCAGPYAHSLLCIDEPSSMKIRMSVKQGYGGVKPGWTRVSFAYFTSIDELEFILSAIEFIAKHGKAFLACYDFDLRSGNWTIKSKFCLPTTLKYPKIDNKASAYVTCMFHRLPKTKGTKKGDHYRTDEAKKKSAYNKYMEVAKEIAKYLDPHS